MRGAEAGIQTKGIAARCGGRGGLILAVKETGCDLSQRAMRRKARAAFSVGRQQQRFPPGHAEQRQSGAWSEGTTMRAGADRRRQFAAIGKFAIGPHSATQSAISHAICFPVVLRKPFVLLTLLYYTLVFYKFGGQTK